MTNANLEKIKKFQQDIEELRAQTLAKGKEAFNEVTSDLFERFADLASFSWIQYTPYFNDGDECVFSVQEDFTVVDTSGEEYEDMYYSSSGNYPNDETPWMDDFLSELSELFAAIPEETFKSMFGDHARITASRSGLEVDEFDHD